MSTDLLGAPVRARFVPLACPGCGADLAGRSEDVLAFCDPCRAAFGFERDGLVAVRARTVVVDEPRAPGVVPLPFWTTDRVVGPAFLGARPVSLTRMLTALLPRWRTDRGVRTAPPLGARIPAAGLPETARIAGLDADGEASLLVVPCRPVGRGRWAVPGSSEPLWPDDVLEARELIAAAEARTGGARDAGRTGRQ